MRLRVATFNIRQGLGLDGRHAWPLRRRAAAAAIARLHADVVGLQEVLGFQERFLLDRLPSYAAFAAGRDDGAARGERCTTLYRHERLELLDWTTRWFSETPDVPGSMTWGNTIPRVATLAWFREADGRFVEEAPGGDTAATGAGDARGAAAFGFADCHWDGASARSRERSAEALLEWIAGDLPWIVAGDFNCAARDPALQRLLAGGLRDPLARLGAAGPGAGTHHHWDGQTDWTRIDFVLVTRQWQVRQAAVVQDLVDGRLPSDHWPVVAALALP